MALAKPVFAFTPIERSRILDLVGRRDVSAQRFVDDVEACTQAFDFAADGDPAQQLPPAIDEHLSSIVAAAAQLRNALNALPEDLGMLIDLHLLSGGARRRLAADLAQLLEPLEDVAGAITDIRRSATQEEPARSVHLEDCLVRALAIAYRNRLNCKPTSDDTSGFPAALACILELAGRRRTRVAAAAAAITASRLRLLLGTTTQADAVAFGS